MPGLKKAITMETLERKQVFKKAKILKHKRTTRLKVRLPDGRARSGEENPWNKSMSMCAESKSVSVRAVKRL